MKGKDKRYVGQLFKENKVLLFINFCILCFFSLYELRDYHNMGIGIFDFIIMVLTNHYYILYFMLPIIFIVAGKYLKYIRNVEIIRYNNFYHYTYATMLRFTKWILSYLILHVISLIVIGLIVLKNPTGSVLNIMVTDEQIELLNKYSSCFHGSVLAVTMIIIYMTFGVSVLVTLLSHVNYRYGYKKMILISVIVYLLSFIGFKTNLKTLIPIICFNNYILLHHALFVNGSLSFTWVILSGSLIIGFCLGKIKKIKKLNFNEFILSRKEKVITILFPIALLMIEILRGIVEIDFRVRNVIITTFLGVSEHSSSFISWLRLTILYILPLFFIGISESRIKTYAQTPIVIRYKNKRDFEHRITMEYFKYIALYTFALVSIVNMLYYLEPISLQGKDYLFDIFQVEFTSRILNLYFVIFFVNLVFDFLLFKSLLKRIGSVMATILLVVLKFTLYMLPKTNYLNLNFGILNLYENIVFDKDLLYKLLILIVGIIGYLGVIIIRRYKDVNH